MIDFKEAFFVLFGLVASFFLGKVIYSRKRNIDIENRLTTIETHCITKSEVQEMINDSQKPLTGLLQEQKTLLTQLSGLVAEHNTRMAVIDAIIEGKTKKNYD